MDYTNAVTNICNAFEDTLKGFSRINKILATDSVTFYSQQKMVRKNNIPDVYFKTGVKICFEEDVNKDTLPFYESTRIFKEGNKIEYLMQLFVVFKPQADRYADPEVTAIIVRAGKDIKRPEDQHVFDLIKKRDEEEKKMGPLPSLPPPPPPPSND